jgi:membrane protease YdiL (CAAX protease family)
MKNLYILTLNRAFETEEFKPGMMLLIAALLLVIHRYFGSFEFAIKNFPRFSEYNAAVFMFISAFLLLILIPSGINRIYFRQSLHEYGISMGNKKLGFYSILILYPIISLLMLWPASNTQEMILFYPLDKTAGYSAYTFLRFEIIRVLFFYTAWEFFFRGFMLFGLKKYVGGWLAICIQTIPSCLWHIGMPSGEIFASIMAGILFGVLALKTRSILYPLILHSLIGITLDLLIIINN